MYEGNGLGFTSTANTTASGSRTVDIASQLVGDVPVIGPLLETIAGFLSVGAGRHEADQIVPTQNKFGDFLAQVGAYIPKSNSAPALQQLARNLDEGWTAFQAFIFNKTQFPDGRAGNQAFAYLSPLVEGLKQGIANRLGELGGGTEAMLPYQGGSYFNLEPAVYGVPTFPEAGRLPYVPSVQYRPPVNVADQLMPALLLGGLAFLFFKRSR